MFKRLISVSLAVCLMLLVCVSALGAHSLSNFYPVREFGGTFADVPSGAWFHDGISSVYEFGIMDGRGDGVFDPGGRLTIAETVRLAATIHRGFHTGFTEFPGGVPWYAPYLDYANRHGIQVGFFRNFSVPVTRADFAVMMASALPDEALTPINRVVDGAIPDVFERFSYGQAVYLLYRAGVLTGSDEYGRFFPGRTLSRAEAAVIVSRMVDGDARVSFSLNVPLSAEQIYANSSPAVFLIDVLDADGEVVKGGSGFFICESGLAVTNHHVIVGASAVRITLNNGEVFEGAGLYDFDRENDAALIQVAGSGFPYLEISEDTLRTGATVFALGSPLGLQSSFSRGIVSQSSRFVDGTTFIQLDAAISTGSSGGALLDVYGRVVGVTAATMPGSQNINLAVPIEVFSALNRETYASFDSLLTPVAHISGFYPAPDFGAHFDVRVWDSQPALAGTSFSFRIEDFPGDADELIEEFINLVEQNFFVHVGYIIFRNARYSRFFNDRHNVVMSIARESIRDTDVFTINVAYAGAW